MASADLLEAELDLTASLGSSDRVNPLAAPGPSFAVEELTG